MMELNLIDALAALVHALIFGSLVYFLYLVVRFGDLSQRSSLEGDRAPARGDPGCSFISLWLGQAEHAGPAVALRFRDSA